MSPKSSLCDKGTVGRERENSTKLRNFFSRFLSQTLIKKSITVLLGSIPKLSISASDLLFLTLDVLRFEPINREQRTELHFGRTLLNRVLYSYAFQYIN